MKMKSICILILVLLILPLNLLAEDQQLSKDNRNLNDSIDSDHHSELALTPVDILIVLWDNDTVSKYIAAAGIVGWVVVIILIIVSPPVGMAAAILTVLGLNITTLGMAYGLGELFGVW